MWTYAYWVHAFWPRPFWVKGGAQPIARSCAVALQGDDGRRVTLVGDC